MNIDLLPGEEFTFQNESSFMVGFLTNDEINEKYDKGEVRIITEQARYPLTSIKSMLASGNYELNPDFQRRHRWSNYQKSLLIESFIMNVPIPPIFLYEDKFSHYQVMDGLQRLTAINDFYNDKFALEGLEEWSELNTKKYSQLPDQVKKGIDRRYLSSIILLQETARDHTEAQKLKQLVFERINSGGVKLQPQESRNAIYRGKFNDLCINLSRNFYLCKTWDIPEQTTEEINSDGEIINENLSKNLLFREMFDVELVLRFFANRQRSKISFKTFKSYLDEYLIRANKYDSQLMSDLAKLFNDTLKLCYDIFGEKAFWMYRKRNDIWSWYPNAATVIYDPLTYVLSNFVNNSSELVRKKELIQSEITTFYQNNYAEFEGRNTNPSIILKRQECYFRFFEKFI